jgi:hypothetical protein
MTPGELDPKRFRTTSLRLAITGWLSGSQNREKAQYSEWWIYRSRRVNPSSKLRTEAKWRSAANHTGVDPARNRCIRVCNGDDCVCKPCLAPPAGRLGVRSWIGCWQDGAGVAAAVTEREDRERRARRSPTASAKENAEHTGKSTWSCALLSPTPAPVDTRNRVLNHFTRARDCS